MTHLVLIAALWGYVASWANQILKQDGWPKGVNAILADAVVVVTAALVTMQQQGGTFTLHTFWQAVLAAFAAAVINHQFFLVPTGVGPALKTATSLKR